MKKAFGNFGNCQFKNSRCRPIAPKPRGMPPLTHRGVGRPRLATTYAAARAGMVAGPAVMAAAAAANQKRQLGGPGGQLQAPGVPKRPRMMSQYRVPESGDPMRLGNPVQVRRGD